MNRKHSLIVLVITLAVALLLSVSGAIAQEQGSQSPQSAIGTAFTYQGQLKNASGPINDHCDFEFSLWDSADSTTGQISTTQTINNVTVSGGLFTVALDFGASAFTGEARWLQIAVKCGSDTTFTPLTPRQPLTPAPYALALPGLRTQQNATSPNVIGGHRDNAVAPGVYGAVIAGGGANGAINSVSANYATIGGGYRNTITMTASYASIGGGESNAANIDHAAIGGGGFNTARGAYSTIGGGGSNMTGDFLATVGGGNHNTASGGRSTVGGGESNTAGGLASTVPGGDSNIAQGNYAFAAGRQAQANHSGTFVWADAIGTPFASTGANQFDVRATGGVSLSVGSANARVNSIPLLPRALVPTANTATTVDSADYVGWYTSLTIGADGLPVVSYYDATNSSLKVLHCGNVDCTSGNISTTVDNAGNVGEHTSLTIGADGLPVVSYYDNANEDLKVLHCGNAACTSGNVATTVDSADNVGQFTSLTIGADGLPVVSYFDGTYGYLKVLHCGNAACTSGNISTTVDSAGNVGQFTSLTIGADGLPVVSYYDATNNDQKVLHCGNAACTSGNVATTVDSAGSVGGYTALTIGADGLPVISYSDSTNDHLKMLHCSNPFCTPYFRRR